MSEPPRAGSRFHRRFSALVGRPAFWAVFVGVLFALPLVRALRRQLPAAPPVLATIGSFSGTIAGGNRPDRLGQPLDDAELAGAPWIATFMDPADPKCDQL